MQQESSAAVIRLRCFLAAFPSISLAVLLLIAAFKMCMFIMRSLHAWLCDTICCNMYSSFPLNPTVPHQQLQNIHLILI